MSPSSLCSSRFLGLRVAPPPRCAAAFSLSPLSPSTFRSPSISAAHAAASELAHASPSAVASPSSPSPFSLYDVLGVPPTASSPEIKAAYRRLALECHPDVVAASRRGASADEFMRVRAAYTTLSDPGKRADYDRELTAAAAMQLHNRRQSAASPRSYTRSTSYPSYSRRTWETDQCW